MGIILVEAVPGIGGREGQIRFIAGRTANIAAVVASPATAISPIILHLGLDEAERVRDQLLWAIDTLKDAANSARARTATPSSA